MAMQINTQTQDDEEMKSQSDRGGLLVPVLSDTKSNAGSSLRSRVSQRAPKVRKVNGYIIFYDEVIGQGQFGTVVKAQLATDLLKESDRKSGSAPVVRSTVDASKTIYACKIFDAERFTEEDMQHVLKEVKIHSLLHSDYAIKHYQTIKTSQKIYMI